MQDQYFLYWIITFHQLTHKAAQAIWRYITQSMSFTPAFCEAKILIALCTALSGIHVDSGYDVCDVCAFICLRRWVLYAILATKMFRNPACVFVSYRSLKYILCQYTISPYDDQGRWWGIEYRVPEYRGCICMTTCSITRPVAIYIFKTSIPWQVRSQST